MYTRDNSRGRDLYVTSFHRGLNLFTPKDALEDGMLSGGENFRVKGQVVIPPKGLTTQIIEDVGEPILSLFPFEDNLIIACASTVQRYYNNTLYDLTPEDMEPVSTWYSTVALHEGDPYIVLSSDGVNPLYMWNSTLSTITAITDAPQSRYIIGYRGRLMAGNVYDAGAAEWLPYRLQWSEINNLETWDTGSAGFYDFIDSTDAIGGFLMLPEDVLIVFKRDTTWIGYPTGDAYDPLSLRLLGRVGLKTASSIQSYGAGGFFLGNDDVYRIDANGLQSIGRPVRASILNATKVWSFIDVIDKEYYLVADDVGWIYNFEEDAWSMCDMTGISCLGVWYVNTTS